MVFRWCDRHMWGSRWSGHHWRRAVPKGATCDRVSGGGRHEVVHLQFLQRQRWAQWVHATAIPRVSIDASSSCPCLSAVSTSLLFLFFFVCISFSCSTHFILSCKIRLFSSSSWIFFCFLFCCPAIFPFTSHLSYLLHFPSTVSIFLAAFAATVLSSDGFVSGSELWMSCLRLSVSILKYAEILKVQSVLFPFVFLFTWVIHANI